MSARVEEMASAIEDVLREGVKDREFWLNNHQPLLAEQIDRRNQLLRAAARALRLIQSGFPSENPELKAVGYADGWHAALKKLRALAEGGDG